MATAEVLHPSDVAPHDVAGETEEPPEAQGEPERVLGASTADQVLERWHGFMAETSKLLKSQLEPPAFRHRLPLSKLTVATPTSSQVDWSNQLGLSCSQTGRVVYSLTAAVEQARSCVQQASKIYDSLGIFGEALGPEMPEEDSLQTPPSLLIELAELRLALRFIHVEKASSAGAAQLPELGENAMALLQELQEATPLLRGIELGGEKYE
eukprot:Skav217655  [mRNA]  locus=scaffold2919:60861:62694:+ [translate_table: standard]